MNLIGGGGRWNLVLGICSQLTCPALVTRLSQANYFICRSDDIAGGEGWESLRLDCDLHQVFPDTCHRQRKELGGSFTAESIYSRECRLLNRITWPGFG
jgi:hypothetical protein